MGRSGRLLAAEHYRVRADVTVLSKALGGGLPLAAVLMNRDLADSLAPGMHGCTFGGGPTVTAAGLWVLARVSRPSLLARVRKRARELDEALQDLVARHPHSLSGTRGLGLLRAIEVAPGAAFDAPALLKAARAAGLLLVRGGERALRLMPPLTVTLEDIQEAAARLDRALVTLETTPKEPAK